MKASEVSGRGLGPLAFNLGKVIAVTESRRVVLRDEFLDLNQNLCAKAVPGRAMEDPTAFLEPF